MVTEIFVEVPNVKFHGNSIPGGGRTDVCGEMDGRV